MSKRAAAGGSGGGGGSAGAGAGASSSGAMLTRAAIPHDQLGSLQKRSLQLLVSLEELQAELVLGGEGIVMQWPQLLSRLSGLLSHLVFLSSSLTSPQTTFYSAQINALEAALRKEAITSNLFSPSTADQPNEARDAIRAKPHQLPANVDRLRFSDVASRPRPGSMERVGNKLPFLAVHPFEALPGMVTAVNAAAASASHPGIDGTQGATGEAGGLAPEDPAAAGQHLNYLYNLLRTRPDDTVSAEDAAFLRDALPSLLPELDASQPSLPTHVTRAQADKLKALQKAHDRSSLRALRTWFHLAAATDENGVRYDWKTRVGPEDLDSLLAPDAGEAGAQEEQEPIMEEDLEEGEEGEDSDADMEEIA